MRHNRADQYTCTVAHRLDEKRVADWRALWKRSKHRHFFNSPGFFEACREAFDLRRYAILFCYREGVLCAVLSLAEGKILGIRGYCTPGSAGNFVDKCAFLADEYSPELVRAVLAAACRLGPIRLAEMEESQASLVRLRTVQGFKPRVSESPFLSFAENPDVLQHMSHGRQRELRRRVRQMSKATTFHIAGIEALDIVTAVEQNSYRPRRRMALFTKGDAEHFLRLIAERIPDSIRIGVLSFDGEPVATVLGFALERTFYWYHIAFREEYSRFGPGKIAFYLMLEELKRQGFDYMDFLRGDSSLKRQFVHGARSHYDVYVAPSLTVLLWWRLAFVVRRILKSISARLRVVLISWPRLETFVSTLSRS